MNIQNEITKELALKIISSRHPVKQEGRFTATVERVGDYYAENKDGRDTIAIVNLNLMTTHQQKEAKALMQQGLFQRATNKQMAVSIREGDYIPSKGEVLDVNVHEKENKDGILSLFIKTITPKKAEKLGKIDMSMFEDLVEGVEISEEVPAFSSAKVTTKV